MLIVVFALWVQFIGSNKVVFKFEEAPEEKTASQLIERSIDFVNRIKNDVAAVANGTLAPQKRCLLDISGGFIVDEHNASHDGFTEKSFAEKLENWLLMLLWLSKVESVSRFRQRFLK